MFAIGNNQLKSCKCMEDGEVIKCPHCGQTHIVIELKDEDDYPSGLFVYDCGDKSFVAGVAGKNIMVKGS